MNRQELVKELAIENNTKMVLLVMDGVGDLPGEDGKTALEKARTPNFDRLAHEATLGMTVPVARGITPGSGPGHLGLFGYDPIENLIGRGVLEALGIDMELTHSDVAARGNFATMDDNGIIVDRRAGRLPTEENQKLCAMMSEKIKKIGNAEVIIKSVKEHRFVVVLRGEGLCGDIADTDPQKTGVKALNAQPLKQEANETAKLVDEFTKQVNEVLKHSHPANTVLLRGFAQYPDIPKFGEINKVRAAAIANYPMYRGLARLVGMHVVPTGDTIESEFDTLAKDWDKYDFFYLHIKKTDSYGEDGNRDGKVHIIKEVDGCLPKLLDLKPDVLVVGGDHSTPAPLKGHSWHPSPLLLLSKYIISDSAKRFTERNCVSGGLGIMSAQDVIPLMLANALRLKKFGA
jgi:2,3-bisphosphoglycerate-independent phosphoglycerate mutase